MLRLDAFFFGLVVAVCASATGTGAVGPQMVHFPQIVSRSLQKMNSSASERNSRTWLSDFAFSTVKGKEMTSGLFHMKRGNALNYTYTYDEMKYIVSGEFHLTDGTGQKVVAKAGDLVHFPKGTAVVFETPNEALGWFTGQRAGAAAAMAQGRPSRSEQCQADGERCIDPAECCSQVCRASICGGKATTQIAARSPNAKMEHYPQVQLKTPFVCQMRRRLVDRPLFLLRSPLPHP